MVSLTPSPRLGKVRRREEPDRPRLSTAPASIRDLCAGSQSPANEFDVHHGYLARFVECTRQLRLSHTPRLSQLAHMLTERIEVRPTLSLDHANLWNARNPKIGSNGNTASCLARALPLFNAQIHAVYGQQHVFHKGRSARRNLKGTHDYCLSGPPDRPCTHTIWPLLPEPCTSLFDSLGPSSPTTRGRYALSCFESPASSTQQTFQHPWKSFAATVEGSASTDVHSNVTLPSTE